MRQGLWFLTCLSLMCWTWTGLAYPSLSWADGLQLSPKTNRDEVQKRLRPRRIALVIGVRKYTHRTWNDLRYPSQDAQKFKAFLSKYGAFDEVLLLTRPGQTTRKGLRQGLKWLRARNRSEHDTVLVYVSGHGTVAQPRKGAPPERYLVATDSSGDIPNTAIPLAEIKTLLQSLPSRRKAVVLASCYVSNTAVKVTSGHVKGLASGIKGTYSLGHVSKTTLILSAAGYMQPAYETDRIRGDVYTHFLLQCAQEQWRKRQRVTAIQAHRCATPRTYRFVRRHLGQSQTPSMESKVMGDDNLWLAGVPRTQRLQRNSQQRFGWLRLQRHRYRKVTIRPKGAKGPAQPVSLDPDQDQGSLTLRLPEGSYNLQWFTPGGQLRTKVIRVAPGATLFVTPGDRTAEDNDISAGSSLDNISFRDWGGYINVGPDVLFAPRLHLTLRAGLFFNYGSIGLAFGGTMLSDTTEAGPVNELLFRFGVTGEVGVPVKWSKVDLFFYGYVEMGFWQTVERSDESIFAFQMTFGPQIRLRVWVSDDVALRFSGGVLFAVSPDNPSTNAEGIKFYNWSFRPLAVFAFGLDFGFPSSIPRDLR